MTQLDDLEISSSDLISDICTLDKLTICECEENEERSEGISH